MIDYLEHKVTEAELPKIFKNNSERSSFAWEYSYFGDDGNDAFYQEFIERNISEHRLAAQEDAIYISIGLNFFKPSFITAMRNILYSKRTWRIKLTALDWLFYFYKDIPEDEFVEMNEYVSKHATEDLLEMQSILNLLLIRDGIQLVDQLILCFTSTDDVSVFDRFVNILEIDTNQLVKKFTNETINKIKEIVMSKQELSKERRDGIVKELSGLFL